MGWNLAWMIIIRFQVTSSRRFSIFQPQAELWAPPAVPLGAQKWPKIFFQFFKFFRFYWIDWCLKCMSIAKYQGFLPNSNEYRRLQLQWSNLLRRRSTFHFFSVSAFFHRGFEGCIPTLIRRITFILSSIPVGLTMSGATTSLFTKLLLIRDRKALWFETPTLAEIMPFFLISFFRCVLASLYEGLSVHTSVRP